LDRPVDGQGQSFMEVVTVNQTAARTQPAIATERIFCVLQWLGLDPQVKLAWIYLWLRAGQKPGTLTVHQSEIGAAQGITSADRAGKTALERLQAAHLIDVGEHKGAYWTFHMVDPVRLKDAIGRVARPDEQPQLFEDAPAPAIEQTDDDPPATIPIEGASDVTRAYAPDSTKNTEETATPEGKGASDITCAPAPCNTDSNNTSTANSPICSRAQPQLQDKEKRASDITCAPDGPSATRMPSREMLLARQAEQRAAADRNPSLLRDVLVESLSRKATSFHDDTKKIEARIAAIVADPLLYQGKIAQVANAANANPKVYADLETLLSQIVNKFGNDPSKAGDRGRYFNTSVRRMLARHGVEGRPT
jgi:hypothetical protein